MQKKPKVIIRCVANRYAASDERIIEFTNGICGGLMSLLTMPDGTLSVSIYQQDATVKVNVSEPSRVGRTLIPKGAAA